MKNYQCPVCGYDELQESPRSESGGGSYEICPSCGFQFGVTDDDEGVSYLDWREAWIKKGMPWNSKGITPPISWNPELQLIKTVTVCGSD
jgi:transcription elongation factor Elf1